MNKSHYKDNKEWKSKMLHIIACPNCKIHLEEKNNSLFCSHCQKSYSINDGIFRAVENSYYWGEIDLAQSKQLLQEARELGWTNAVRNLKKTNNDQFFDYLTKANRADWRFNLPLNRHVRVLDIGSGWGQIPFLMADAYDEVWSLEYIKERIEWQQIRRLQEDINNLFLVQSSVTSLPFLHETFDIISMNGVLEWVGLMEKDIAVRELQLNVLKDIFQILKPGGFLYIGIENRIGYSMFLGEYDHSGMKFTSLMPRGLANYYVRNFKKNVYRTDTSPNEYRTYTYSPSGYKKLLHDAGYSQVRLYWVETGYNNPIAFAPINESRKIDYYYKQIIPRNFTKKIAKIILRALIQCGFMKIFSPQLLIYAQKERL